MTKVAIVTDSTSYVPAELLAGKRVEVVPLTLIWGAETFKDGVDIQPDEFYTRLAKASVMPSTSQPSPAEFQKVFKTLLDEGYDVLAVLISNHLSGTVSSATQAKEALGNPSRIEIVDTQTVSMALGLLVLKAARAAAEGLSLAECKAVVEKYLPKVGMLVVVDTLEFLHRGGRIGGGKRFLGTALNIKPILEVTGGKLEAVQSVRTRSKALARLLELIEARSGKGHKISLGCVHASAEADAQAVIQQAKGVFFLTETIIAPVSPVIGTHVGPGTIGLAYCIED